MKRRFTHIDIDHFFRSLDRLEPLYNENKVHQIINSPDAMARLKGKSFKPLKIIIMTSLFAIIVSALLFWPGHKLDQTQSDQLSNSVEIENNTQPKNEPTINSEKENYSTIQNEETLRDNESINQSKEQEQNTALKIQTELSEPKPIQQTTQQPILTDTIKSETQLTPPNTIKGDLKMVVADQELLEKLGFQFEYLPEYNPDSIWEYDITPYSVYYQNQPEDSIKHPLVSFSMEREITDRVMKTNATRFWQMSHSINPNVKSTTHHDFYPIFESYLSGRIFYKSKNLSQPVNFEAVNDTLFPIYIPQSVFEKDYNDMILWFNITDEFITKLPENKRSFAEEIKKLKTLKSEFPSIDLINYEQEPLIDSSRFVTLSRDELFKIGFSEYNDTTLLYERDSIKTKKTLKFEKSNNHSYVLLKLNFYGRSKAGSLMDEKYKYENLAIVTSELGDIEDIFYDKNEVTTDLIPILVKQQQFPDILHKNLVFWFTLSDNLLKQLPENISSDLQKEYNYIIAENKEELEKPECKYFDECKNTLFIEKFKVFPNPANQHTKVTFSLPETIKGRISLVDLAGRERQVLLPETMLSRGNQQFEFDLSDVSEGIYLITLYSEQGIQMQRLIVSH